jgi:ABC-type polysaccharide/polyol phosphate transport system ATPase subunit
LTAAAVRCERLGKRFLVLKSQRTALRALRAFIGGEPLRREMWVLRDLTFEIARGEKVALLGRNGSGKTTLLRLVAGILEPTCGHLSVRGIPRPLFSAQVGFMSELSVVENVFLFGAVHGMDRRALRPRLPEILKTTGLEALAHAPMKDLSTGQVQRLALAVFAESDSDLVILDEVIGNVDHGFLRAADRYFRSLADSARTVVMTSHDTAFLRAYCSSALWIEDGAVRMHGAFEPVVREYEASFEGEAPAFLEESAPPAAAERAR